MTQMDWIHSQSYWYFGIYLSHRKKAIQRAADGVGGSTETQVDNEQGLVHVTDHTGSGNVATVE